MGILFRLSFVCVLILSRPAKAQSNSSENSTEFPTQHPRWKLYLHSLLAYQKSFPGIYTPVDLVRWDKLPKDWTELQIRKYSTQWERLINTTLAADNRRTEETVLSRKANEELYRKIMELEKNTQNFYWMGSTQSTLDSFNENERIAMTPLDAVFQKSEVGAQIFDRIRSKQSSESISGFLIDRKNSLLILEQPSKNYYKIEFKGSADPQELTLRAYYGRDERLGSDIKLRKENFKGFLFNSSSNERFPLGNMPLKNNQWVDERGHAHFEGDGHKH